MAQPLPFDPNLWVTYFDNLANIIPGMDNVDDLDAQRNAWMVNRNIILPAIDVFIANFIPPDLLPNLPQQQKDQLIRVIVLNLYPLIREIYRLDGNVAVAFHNRRQQLIANNPQGNGKRKRRY
jgi:hypothetical protein